jgi:hypothetical protein
VKLKQMSHLCPLGESVHTQRKSNQTASSIFILKQKRL